MHRRERARDKSRPHNATTAAVHATASSTARRRRLRLPLIESASPPQPPSALHAPQRPSPSVTTTRLPAATHVTRSCSSSSSTSCNSNSRSSSSSTTSASARVACDGDGVVTAPRHCIARVRAEHARVSRTLQLARLLFDRVVREQQRQPCMYVADGRTHMWQLAARVAVSALMLEQLVAQLPRHQSVLQPYVALLLQYVYVPDTAAMRDALGGDLRCDAVLDAMAVAAATTTTTTRSDAAAMRARDADDSNSDDDDGCHRDGGSGSRSVSDDSDDALTRLLAPYARMPYVLAHMQLSRTVVCMAHEVRARQLHIQRMPRIFDLTYRNCSKTLLRTVVCMWAKLCRERRVHAQKHRAQWARWRSTQRQRAVVRLWRGYAAATLQAATAESVAKARIYEKKAQLQRYRAEMDAMQRTSSELSSAMRAHEQARADALAELHTLEAAYTTALEHVRQMARTGTLLMDALLLPHAPPHLVARELAALPQLHASATVLRTLVTWADAELQQPRGRETEELCAMTVTTPTHAPAPREHEHTTQQQQQQQHDDDDDDDELAYDGNTRVFTQLLLPHTAPRQTTFFPLYKFLVLMRCIGQKDLNVPAIEVVRMVKTADAAVVAQLVARQHRRDAAQRDDEQQQQQQQHDDDAQPQRGGGLVVAGSSHNNEDNDDTSSDGVVAAFAAASVTSSGEDGSDAATTAMTALLAQLSPELRTTAEDVARILVDSYEHMTNTACVVTADQLLQRDRGVLLVFLAALLRYYTNWVARKTESVMVEVAPAPAADTTSELTTRASSSNDDNNNTTSTSQQQQQQPPRELVGRRHARYPEWYHPPQAHGRWRARVCAQRRWLGVSFSALHRAVLVAKRTRQVLSLEERDRVNALLRCLSFTQLADVLPRDQQLSSRCYVELMRTLEQRFQQLLLVFQMYAICLDDLVDGDGDNNNSSDNNAVSRRSSAKSRSVVAGSGGGNNDGGGSADVNASSSQQQQQQPPQQHDGDDNRSDHTSVMARVALGSAHRQQQQQQQQRWQAQRYTQRYITANGFWHLLCDAGLAGGDGSAVTAAMSTPHDGNASSSSSRHHTASSARVRVGDETAAAMTAMTATVAATTMGAMATLPRPTVLAIVEHVVFAPLRARRDGAGEQTTTMTTTTMTAATRMPQQQQQRQGSASTPRAAHGDGTNNAHHHNHNNNSSSSATPRRRTATAIVQQPPQLSTATPQLVQVGHTRQAPNFARAVLEDRHVDLRYDRGTVCMDALQFAEALIRCAHSWQCLNQQRAAAAATATAQQQQQQQRRRRRCGSRTSSTRSSSSSNSGGNSHPIVVAAHDGTRAMSSANSSSVTTTSAAATMTTTTAVTAAQPRRVSISTQGTAAAASGGGGDASSSRLTYAPCAHVHALNCETLEHVMAEWLLPRVLLGAQLLLLPFRRALRRDGVRRLVARHQDALFALFTRYTRPREAFGLRAVLPPPYTAHVRGTVGAASASRAAAAANASVTTSITASATTQPPPPPAHHRATLRRARLRDGATAASSSATTTTTHRASHAAHARRGTMATTSVTGTTTSGGGGVAAMRDVGIVAVLTLDDVTRMSKELSWLQRPRMTLTAVHHCFDAVVADTARERGLLFFSEFSDLLCALSYFYDTHPLTPLEDKLHAFLTTLVLPHCTT